VYAAFLSSYLIHTLCRRTRYIRGTLTDLLCCLSGTYEGRKRVPLDTLLRDPFAARQISSKCIGVSLAIRLPYSSQVSLSSRSVSAGVSLWRLRSVSWS